MLGHPLSSACGNDLSTQTVRGSEGTLSAKPRHPAHVEDAVPLANAETDSFESRERTPPRSTPLLGDLAPPARSLPARRRVGISRPCSPLNKIISLPIHVVKYFGL